MRAWIITTVGLSGALFGAVTTRADDYYVAPSGTDQSQGTLDKPFATVERAQMAAAPGDTVWIRGGEYKFSGTTLTQGMAFSKSGATGKPIRYFAYAGETPVFDLFELKPQARVTGLDVHANWIHLRGLEVRGVRQIIVGDSWGVRIRGDHNVIEHLHVHDGEAPGVFITSGADNLILNCDSHHNYDPLEDGGNADGFGCHSAGEGNVLRGCRAWENSDDGFDLINAAGACTVEESWAFRNGYIPDTDMVVGNGAGFKSGGYGYPPNTPATGAGHHVIRRNLAFGNRIGFYANFHPGGIDFIHNTAFDNPANFDMRTPGTPSSHTLRNNVAAGSGKAIINFNGGTDDFNSWTLPVMVSADDFMSLDHKLAYAPRSADGALPHTQFAQLRAGSDLIDKGEDRGFSFAGAAPDLGAYEFGLTVPDDPTKPDDTDAGMPKGGADSSAGQSGGVLGQAGARAAAGAGAPARNGAGGNAPPLGAASSALAQAGTSAAAGSGATASTLADAPSGCGCRIGPASPLRGKALALSFAALFVASMRRSRRVRRRLE